MINIRELIESSDECCSNLEQDQGKEQGFKSEQNPLFNTPRPQAELKNEKPYHRIVAFLIAEGHTDAEIAAMVDRTAPTIGYLRKQPHIEREVLALIHGRGDAAIDKLHRAAEEAADALIENMRKAQAEDAFEVVRKNANDILDRKYGKPNQPTTTTIKKNVEEMSLEEINQRLSELQRQREMKSN